MIQTRRFIKDRGIAFALQPLKFSHTQKQLMHFLDPFLKKTTRNILVLSVMISLQLSCKKKDPVNSGNIEIITKHEIASACSELFMTAKQDGQGRNYLYVASKEGGLKIYDINAAPLLKKTIPISQLGSLEVMNLSQSGNYLFLALGNHFGTAQQNPGMAIIDVSDPVNASIKSVWKDATKTSGAGIVETDGNYAYLGAMKSGMIIIDISDKTSPIVKSVFVPSILFPDANPDPAKFNARGMAIRNDIVYLCYDAGGLRIINVADKQNPVEAGRFSNPEMNGKPRAYNNVVLDGSVAYITVDYCGMETLDISIPSNIRLLSWWNPWNCQTNPLNWFSSNGHANEIALDKINKLVFMSTGKSDMQVVSVVNPASPVHKYEYGGVVNNIGTWGISVSNNNIFLSYICNSLPWPFPSNWTGIKILKYEVK
jgi:hypothetical protein